MDKGISAKACPKGTYSDDFNNNNFCTPCSTGSTTVREGSNSSTLCNLASVGYYLLPAGANATAAQCPLHTYNNEEATIYSCKPCLNGLMTRVVGSTGPSDCLVAPGFELKPGAENGWGLESVNPPIARKCLQNTYGVPTARLATAAAVCFPCRGNMYTMDWLTNVTVTDGYMTEDVCVVKPGWGVDATGMVVRCPLGFVNPGYNRGPCDSCPAGYWGIPDDPKNVDAMTVCVIKPGWMMDGVSGLPKPCDKGTFGTGGDLQDIKSAGEGLAAHLMMNDHE
eukprot:gene2654-2954_t